MRSSLLFSRRVVQKRVSASVGAFMLPSTPVVDRADSSPCCGAVASIETFAESAAHTAPKLGIAYGEAIPPAQSTQFSTT